MMPLVMIALLVTAQEKGVNGFADGLAGGPEEGDPFKTMAGLSDKCWQGTGRGRRDPDHVICFRRTGPYSMQSQAIVYSDPLVCSVTSWTADKDVLSFTTDDHEGGTAQGVVEAKRNTLTAPDITITAPDGTLSKTAMTRRLQRSGGFRQTTYTLIDGKRKKAKILVFSEIPDSPVIGPAGFATCWQK